MTICSTRRAVVAVLAVVASSLLACSSSPGSTCAAPTALCGGSCVDTAADVMNCGACGVACAAPANASARCAAGTCGLGACTTGFADCDGNAANGCEVALATSAQHCGACGTACTAPANATASCAAGTCGLGACTTGFADCDGNAANGCEVALATSAQHCGACGTACMAPANATAACTNGACGVGTCSGGFGDCDGIAMTGCEVALATSAQHCGACGNACGQGAICVGGTCRSPYSIDQLVQDSTTGCLPSYLWGQTFVVPTEAALSQVTIWAEARVAGPVTFPSDASVAVFATSGGLPTGAPLAVSSTVTFGVIGGLQVLTFPTPARLSAGVTYALIVTVTGANEINVGLTSTNPYAGGTALEGAPGSMTQKSGFDLTFKASFTP
jgi:hypothetical protein